MIIELTLDEVTELENVSLADLEAAVLANTIVKEKED